MTRLSTSFRVVRYAIAFVVLSGGMLLVACAREAPPEIPEFKRPAKPVVEEDTKPETVAEEPKPEEKAPEPEPEPQAKPEPKPEKKAPPPPEPKVESDKKEAGAPTLVGTWRVTDMSQGGHSLSEMGEMQMRFTFTDDGKVSMEMSMPQMPESHAQEGTYSLSDGQLTITMQGDTKTGSCTFVDNNTVKIDIEDAKMTLTRI